MITPKQNETVADFLEYIYFHRDLNWPDLSYKDLMYKTMALIQGDRKLMAYEQQNWDEASKKRRDSIHCKIINLLGTRK